MLSAPLEQGQHSASCWWRSRRTRGGSSRRCRGGCKPPCQGCRGPGVSWPAGHAGQHPARGTGRGHSGRAAGAGNSSAPRDIPLHRPAWCLLAGSPSAPSPACPTALLCLQYLQHQGHQVGLGLDLKKINLQLTAELIYSGSVKNKHLSCSAASALSWKKSKKHEYFVLHKKHKVHAPFGSLLYLKMLSQPNQHFFLSPSSPLCHSALIHFVDVPNQYLLQTTEERRAN